MLTKVNLTKLYEEDFLLWLEATADLIKNKQLDKLDLVNLLEEIESMGKSQRRELKSRLLVLIMHLLKTKYEPEKFCNSWYQTIIEQRNEIELLLEDSPSLKSEVNESINVIYPKARKNASKETFLPLETFPDICPFSTSEILDEDFFVNDKIIDKINFDA